MATERRSPVFLLAFANEQPEQATYLRGLAKELRCLRQTLAQENTSYVVDFYPNLTIDDLLDSLRKYRNRIALLHYGGHSNSYSLLLQAADGQPAVADSGSLAQLLAQQRGLHLVFLNGCANAAQAEGLLDAGVAVVVATTQLIDDEVAIDFAAHFYAALTHDTTIATAFKEAEAAVQVRKGATNRHLLLRPDVTPSTAMPWQLYYRERAAIDCRLADVIQDPCWGLPALPRLDFPKQPFRRLAWFRRADAEIFFGRSAKIRELYDRIDDPEDAPLILLYGQSGVGKSSLLAAGLLPRLERDYLPHYVRRDRAAGLTATLETALCARTTQRDLRTVWLAHEQTARKPLVAILDQVEEAFTRPQPAPTATPDTTAMPAQMEQKPLDQGAAAFIELPPAAPAPCEMDHFLRTLQPLFQARNQRPRGKLILSFRKEYLAEIEELLTTAELPYSKVFLGPLDHAGVLEAITGVAYTQRLYNHYGLKIAPGVAELIAGDLRRDPDSPLAPTLQILLAKLWERAVEQNRSEPRFDRALYQGLQDNGILLRDFFEQSWQALRAIDAEAVDSGLLLDLLEFHTTPWGTAEQQSADVVEQRYAQHLPARLAALVQGCKDHYLLADRVDDQSEPKGAPAVSRLAHDALAPLVHERFARSEAPGQRARRLLESRLIDWPNAPQSALLNESELALVEQSRAGMRAWDTQEQALVAASRRACDERQQQAEKERAEQARIRQERAAAERRARAMRKILLSTVAAVIVVGVLVAGIWSLRDQALAVELARKTAEQQVVQSLQSFLTDPVASLGAALQAVPNTQAPKPYVPQAEFVLTQALQASLERAYLPLTDQGKITSVRVAVGADQLAVGGDHLWLLAPTLAPTDVITLTTGAPVNAVTWNSAQDRLLVREKEQIKIWRGQEEIAQQAFDALACAAWRPQSQQVSVCSGDTLYLWSYTEARREALITLPAAIKAVHWSPSGRLVAAYTALTTAQVLNLWDTQTGRNLVQAAVELTQVISNTPLLDLAFVDDEHFLTLGDGGTVRLWTTDGKTVHSFGLAADDPQGFVLAPDRQHVLIFLASGTAHLYELATGQRIAEYVGHDGRIMAATWHASGRYLATAGLDGTVRLWEVGAKRSLLTLRGHTDGATAGRPAVVGVAWQDSGQLVSYGEDGTLRLWQVFDQQGAPLCNGLDNARLPACHALAQSFVYDAATIEAAYWLDNQTVVTVDDNSVVERLGLTAAGESPGTQTVCAGSEQFDTFSASADGKRLFFYVEADEENTEEAEAGAVCDTQTGLLNGLIPGPITTAFWMGTDRLLISRPTGEALWVDGTTGATITTLAAITTTVTAAQQSNSGGQLAVATQSGIVYLWAMTDTALAATPDVTLPLEGRWQVKGLAWGTSDRYLVAMGQGLAVWEMNGAPRFLWGEPGALITNYHAAISPDEQWVAIGAGHAIVVREIESRATRWQQADAHSEPVLGLQWLQGARWPNQTHYAAWQAPLVRWFTKEPWPVDSERLLLMSWSGDGTTKVWDWERQTEITRMTDLTPDIGMPLVASVSPDERLILTVSNASTETGSTATVRIWPAWHRQPTVLLQTAAQQMTR